MRETDVIECQYQLAINRSIVFLNLYEFSHQNRFVMTLMISDSRGILLV